MFEFFFHSAISSDNEIITTCGQLVLTGGRSIECNNINYIWSIYNIVDSKYVTKCL